MLAKKLGITQPLIYRYFPSKEDLVREVYNSIYESRWNVEWETILKDRNTPLKDRLIEFYKRYTDVVFARDWMRIYLFSGLRGLDINRWWSRFVEARVLRVVCDELRHESGAPTVAASEPTPLELEMLWSFQGSLFYYAMRRDIYRATVHLSFDDFLGMTIDTLLESAKRLAKNATAKRSNASAAQKSNRVRGAAGVGKAKN